MGAHEIKCLPTKVNKSVKLYRFGGRILKLSPSGFTVGSYSPQKNRPVIRFFSGFHKTIIFIQRKIKTCTTLKDTKLSVLGSLSQRSKKGDHASEILIFAGFRMNVLKTTSINFKHSKGTQYRGTNRAKTGF